MTAKQDKKSIFLFCGDDTFSSHQKLQHWKKGFIQKYGEDAPIEILDGKKLDLQNLSTDIETLPFLADKKLLIIKDFFAQKKTEEGKKLAEIIEKTPDFCVVIFHENISPPKNVTLYKRIAKLGTIEEFPELSPQKTANWIIGRAKTLGIKIGFASANYLAQHCGTNLWQISNELNKLHTYAQDQEITNEMIDALTTPSLSASIFKLTDSLGSKNRRAALQTFKTLQESGEDVIRTFFMIVRHFRILIQVKDLLAHQENQFSMAKKLKQPPFVIKKNSEQSRNFSSEDLRAIYQSLLEIDTRFKTGKIKTYQTDNRELLLAIEKLIINCCTAS